MSEKGAVTSSGEKGETTPKIDSFTEDESVPGNSDVVVASPVLRRDLGNTDEMNFPDMSKNPQSDMTMKDLLAAAEKARKRQALFLNSSRNPFPLSPNPNINVGSINSLRVDPRPASLSSDSGQISVTNQHGNENDEFEERGMSSVHQASWSPLSGGTYAIVARNAFEGMIETLSRTKESIGRATRHAIDCANYVIANEVVELLIRKLGSEASLHRRVDLLVGGIYDACYPFVVNSLRFWHVYNVDMSSLSKAQNYSLLG